MLTVKAGVTLNLTNIILDGNNAVTGTDVGGMIQVKKGNGSTSNDPARLNIGEGTVIQNSKTNANGAAININDGAIVNMTGGKITGCVTIKDGGVGGAVTVTNGTFNMTGGEILEKNPNLKLQFGLHATSVVDDLDEIAKVDPHIEILWEDCGEFPFSYDTFVSSEESYQETLLFVEKLLKLRGGKGVGFLFKGVMMQDWKKFVYQRGPFVLGENAESIKLHDRQIRANAWRIYSSAWIKNGDRALEMMQFINKNKVQEVNIGLAGTLDGGIYLPMALCSKMFRNSNGDFNEILLKTTRMSCISYD
jgi:hypothetical protein